MMLDSPIPSRANYPDLKLTPFATRSINIDILEDWIELRFNYD